MTNTTADVTVYENEKWLYPIWKGDTVYAETAFILKNALGEIRPKRLAYPIKKIISVRSFDLKTVYEEGKDYEINEYGELQVLPGGKIPYLNWNEYRFSEFVQDDVHMPSADALGAQCVRELFADKDGMSAYVLAVTYTHEPDDYYDVTAGKSEKFPRTIGKLKSGKDIKIALYGDSITYGWGASGMHDIAKPPFTPPYHEMAAQYIESKFHIKAERENFAVSGMCADWGIKEENAGKAAAKLGESVVITVTANDGYELKELTVGGEAVTVNKDGTYTFTIKGNSDVEISATFAEKAKEEKKSGCKSSVIASSAMLAAAGIAVCAALKKKRG